MFRKKTNRKGLIMRNPLSYLIRELAFINGASITDFCEKGVAFYLAHRERIEFETCPVFTKLQGDVLKELYQRGASKEINRAANGKRRKNIENRNEENQQEELVPEGRQMQAEVLSVRMSNLIKQQIKALQDKTGSTAQDLFVTAMITFIGYNIDQLLETEMKTRTKSIEQTEQKLLD